MRVGVPKVASAKLDLSALVLWNLLICCSSIGAAMAETSGPAQLSGLSVSVQPARKMCFKEQVEITGVLVARQEVEIRAPRDGLKVTELLVEPLDKVTTGQVLARLTITEAPNAGGTVAISSPVAGVVRAVDAGLGTPVYQRQGPLFRIITGGNLDFRAEVPIPQLKALAVGQIVTVTPLGELDLSANVRSVDLPVEPGSQLGRVRVGLPNTRDLRVGTFARGIVAIGERCGIGIPYSSVMYQEEGTIVHVLRNDKVEARQVLIGLLSGIYVEVRSGVAASDLIVTRAGPFLRDGDQVNPIRRGSELVEKRNPPE